jgi:hypothetical protein
VVEVSESSSFRPNLTRILHKLFHILDVDAVRLIQPQSIRISAKVGASDCILSVDLSISLHWTSGINDQGRFGDAVPSLHPQAKCSYLDQWTSGKAQ